MLFPLAAVSSRIQSNRKPFCLSTVIRIRPQILDHTVVAEQRGLVAAPLHRNRPVANGSLFGFFLGDPYGNNHKQGHTCFPCVVRFLQNGLFLKIALKIGIFKDPAGFTDSMFNGVKHDSLSHCGRCFRIVT